MRSKINVLVVDDMVAMRRIISTILCQIGFDKELVHFAEDGEKALQVLSENTIDFIVTDWNMPVMTGLDLIKSVRANEQFINIPILMVTAEAKRDQIVEAAQAGVNGYIVKPFNSATMDEKISKIFAPKAN